MKSSKRVIAPNPDRSDVPSGHFVPFLNHITEGCTIRYLDPSSCIPLFLSREKSENAVKRLVYILNGDMNVNQRSVGFTCMVAAIPTSVVLPLVNELAYIIDDHLSALYESDEDRRYYKEKHDEWFGVIDGCQYQCALTELRELIPSKWMYVSWKVFCVRPGLELSEYQKLSIVQNERNKSMYHYEPTLFDTLRTLRSIHDDLYKKRLKASRTGSRGLTIHHRGFAHMYDGGDHNHDTTISQAVSVATRLSKMTINAIGDVANMSCVDLILSNSRLNEHSLASSASVMSHYDYRLFRKFVSTSTLRGAKNFMNAVRDKDEDAQTNTIYTARHSVENNEFRSIIPKELNDHFLLAKLALYEEAKFLIFLDQTTWPLNMDTTRENLLRTTTHDKSLRANEGNTSDILPVLWSCFKRLYAGRAKGLEEKQASSNAGDAEGEDKTGDAEEEDKDNSNSTPEATLETAADPNDMSEEEKKRLAKEEENRKEQQRRNKLRDGAEDHFKQIGIVTHDVTFEEFQRDIWSTNATRVDLVLSAVPQTKDDDSISESLPVFCKAVMNTVSYVFLILNEVDFHKYQKAFRSTSFKVCDRGFSIIYDISTIKRRKAKDFPQKNSEIALVAKTQGSHPTGFQPDFVGQHNVNHSDTHAQYSFASLINVQSCEHRLKHLNDNVPIFPGKRSTELFARIIKIFSPPNGSVIDPFGGPLTTALACLETSRKCTSMDARSEAMSFARSRLRIFATPKASMADVEVFIDPPSSEQIKGDGPAASHATTNPRNGKHTPQRSGQSHSPKKPRVVVAEQKEDAYTSQNEMVEEKEPLHRDLNGEDVTEYIEDNMEYIEEEREGSASQDDAEPVDANALAPRHSQQTNGEGVDVDESRASKKVSVDNLEQTHFENANGQVSSKEMDSASTLLSLIPR